MVDGTGGGRYSCDMATKSKAKPELTIAEAATRLGITPERMRQLVRGRVGRPAVLAGRSVEVPGKLGPVWLVPVAEVERYERERKSAGRPRIDSLSTVD